MINNILLLYDKKKKKTHDWSKNIFLLLYVIIYVLLYCNDPTFLTKSKSLILTKRPWLSQNIVKFIWNHTIKENNLKSDPISNNQNFKSTVFVKLVPSQNF